MSNTIDFRLRKIEHTQRIGQREMTRDEIVAQIAHAYWRQRATLGSHEAVVASLYRTNPRYADRLEDMVARGEIAS